MMKNRERTEREETGKCVRRNGKGAAVAAPFLQRQTCCVLSGRSVRMQASGGPVRQIKRMPERIGDGISQAKDSGRSGCDISDIYAIAGIRRRPGVLGGVCPLTRCVCVRQRRILPSLRDAFLAREKEENGSGGRQKRADT